MNTPKQFTGAENHSITTAEALTFIKYYREHFGADAEPGCFFYYLAVEAIISQPNAVGLRYYYGADELGMIRLILVGATANRQDLLDGEALKLSIMHPPTDVNGKYDRTAISHVVSHQHAAEMTTRYRETLLTGQPKGGFFAAKAVQRLLDEPECHGLRFFYGANREGKRVVVGMCTDRYGAEMLYGHAIDISYLCPPFCGARNSLNGGVTFVAEQPLAIK